MQDVTIALSYEDRKAEQAERSERIAEICWESCPDCQGRGWQREEWWWTDDGTPPYVLRPDCPTCDGSGEIQVNDPAHVAALLDAAEDAREALPEAANGRIDRGLELALAGKVHLNGNGTATVESQSTGGRSYAINGRCNCPDAGQRAPAVNDRPACKHQIAVWLIRKANGAAVR